MSPDTAEMAIAQSPSVSVPPARATPQRQWLAARWLTLRWHALCADATRMAAVRDSWRALWVSRLLVLTAGVGTVATLGFGPVRGAFNPPGVARGLGWLGNLLAAPVARWDSVWYLVIAKYGYRPELSALGTASRDAFFPLYPLGLRGLSDLGLPPVLAGVVFSLAAFAAALYGIHRLSTLELGGSDVEGTRQSGAAQVSYAASGPGGEAIDSGAAGPGSLARRAAAGIDPGPPARRAAAGTRPAPAGIDCATVARLAVLVMALTPMAFYFSAVYSESLYLALSVGLFWCARQGRWAWVGVLGALATATRSTGVVLLAPALVLYLYGPREDRAADVDRVANAVSAGVGRLGRVHPSLGRLSPDLGRLHSQLGRLHPRYRMRANVLWLILIPAGMGAYMAYLGLNGGNPMAPLSSQNVWGRHFAGPYVAAWDGARAALDGARQLLSGQSTHVYYPIAGGSPAIAAGHNLMLFAFLVAAVPLLVIVLRRLPLAYGAYVLVALALPLSYPVAPQPLMSLSRFELVLFPLGMGLAVWLAAHPRMRVPTLVSSAVLMMLFTAQFATWHWVA